MLKGKSIRKNTKWGEHVIEEVIDSVVTLLTEVECYNLSDWASNNFCLSADSSHGAGKWQSYPFQIGWMDAFSNDDIEEVVLRKSRRIGYTKTLLSFIAYNAVSRRRNQAVWWPTDEDRNRFVRDELDPMIRDVSCVKNALLPRVALNTIRRKKFYGSTLNILGGKTPRAYRGLTLDVGMLDEISAFDLSIGDAISPVEAVRGRLEGSPYPKLIIGSTPRVKGSDHIDARIKQCDEVMFYHIICPHCQKYHQLYFGGKNKEYGFKGYGLNGEFTDNVYHVCPYCRKSIDQTQYLYIYGDGCWISESKNCGYTKDRQWIDRTEKIIKPPRRVAFSIWAGYSPQRSWEDIVDEFQKAVERKNLDDFGPLKIFVNETLGESWEDTHDKSDLKTLVNKIGDYDQRTVPEGGLVLCTGIDTQIDRWEAVTWAYGNHDRMWCVDYSVLRGNPADLEDWNTVLDDYLLKTEFIHASGKRMKISATAIDVMGHNTINGYNYCRGREHRRVYAVRGSSELRTPNIKSSSSQQDVDFMGRKIRNGVRLWSVGTNIAKDLFFQRCSLDPKTSKGGVFFYRDISPRFFDGLTAESRVLHRTSRTRVYRWVNTTGKPNEAIDCTVYSIFAADMMGLIYRSAHAWDSLQKVLFPDTKRPEKEEPKSPKTVNDDPMFQRALEERAKQRNRVAYQQQFNYNNMNNNFGGTW